MTRKGLQNARRRRVVGAVISVIAVIVTLVGGTPRLVAAQASEIRTDDERLAAVVAYVDEQRIRLGIPGMALAVVVGEQVVLVEGFGEASEGSPVTGDTVFLINSISKSITAVALMQLVDAGRVDLDAAVSAYVPELSPGGDKVTVRDVMHHRSGVQDRPLDKVGQTDLGANVARLEPDFRPNAEWEYQNANYDTLALIVERVSGVSFADYIEENVFGPLDMWRSAVGSDRAGPLVPAEGHYPWLFAGYQPLDRAVDHGQLGSAAMYASAQDLAHFLIAHMNNGVYGDSRVVSDAGIAILREPRSFSDQVVYGYGGGLYVEPANSSDTPAAMAPYPTVWHDGASLTFRSVIWMTLGPDIGMVLLANGNDVTNESWLTQISYGTRLLLSGEEPIEVMNLSDLLTQRSKLIYLAIALLQLAMLLLVVPTLQRLRRAERPTPRGWLTLALASFIDIAAAVLVFIVTPAVAEEPLSEVMELPDYRILITIIIIGIGWGVVRTVLAARWLRRSRHAQAASTIATA